MSNPGNKTNQYEVYGIFCSINCAKKFVLERKGFVQSLVLLQLNELCCSVFGMDSAAVFDAKGAPPRFFLKMFGGQMDIEEFRAKSLTTHTILVMPPFVSHAMILECHSTEPLATPDSNVEETKGEELVEALREGQHMLRGLRRPTRPLSPPPPTSQNETSRFEKFIAENVKGDEPTGKAEKPLRSRAQGGVSKKPRKKEPPQATNIATPKNPNTLNSFLMMHPPSSSMETE